MMTNDEIIAVVRAHSEGKAVQSRHRDATNWQDNAGPVWNFNAYDYRIKPVPREWVLVNKNIEHCHFGSEINGAIGWHVYDANCQVSDYVTIRVREILD